MPRTRRRTSPERWPGMTYGMSVSGTRGEPGTATQRSLSIFVTRDARGAANTLSVIVQAPGEHQTLKLLRSHRPLPPRHRFVRWWTGCRWLSLLLAPDARQTRLYVSPAVTQITGYSPEEFLRQSWRSDRDWTEIVHPLDRARVAAEDAPSVAAGEPFQMEYRHIRKDGTWAGSAIFVSPCAVPAAPSTTGWVCCSISRMRWKRHARKRISRAIVEAAQDGILSVSGDGTIARDWNGAERIYGYSAEEAIGGGQSQCCARRSWRPRLAMRSPRSGMARSSATTRRNA